MLHSCEHESDTCAMVNNSSMIYKHTLRWADQSNSTWSHSMLLNTHSPSAAPSPVTAVGPVMIALPTDSSACTWLLNSLSCCSPVSTDCCAASHCCSRYIQRPLQHRTTADTHRQGQQHVQKKAFSFSLSGIRGLMHTAEYPPALWPHSKRVGSAQA